MLPGQGVLIAAVTADAADATAPTPAAAAAAPAAATAAAVSLLSVLYELPSCGSVTGAPLWRAPAFGRPSAFDGDKHRRSGGGRQVDRLATHSARLGSARLGSARLGGRHRRFTARQTVNSRQSGRLAGRACRLHWLSEAR